MAAQRIGEEARELWAAMFGAVPVPTEDPSELLKCVLERIPAVGYDRFAHDRPDANLVFPKSGRH